MALYVTKDQEIWDDMGGEAKNFPSWPKDAVPISDSEAEKIRTSSLVPAKELTAIEKLSRLGLTVDDIRTLISGA